MRARGRRPRDRPLRRTLPPSPRPLWVTYLCRRRRRPHRHERYHFMSFPPFFLARNALISCARNREWRGCLPARSHSEGRDWPPPSLSIHNPFQTNPAAPPFSLTLHSENGCGPISLPSPLRPRPNPALPPFLRSFHMVLKRLKAAAASQRRRRPLARWWAGRSWWWWRMRVQFSAESLCGERRGSNV